MSLWHLLIIQTREILGNMIRKITTLIFACFLFNLNLQAQDIHLSQFYTNNLNLNPALTGNFDGNYRITLNYRSQWSQLSVPIVTTMLGFEKKIDLYTQQVSVGGLIVHDRFSDFNIANSKIFLSGSYGRNLGNAELSAGLQLGYIIKRQDFSDQTFPVQWNYEQGDFDISLPNLEADDKINSNYFDMNFGINLSKTWSKKIKTNIGYSAFHITVPNESFTSTDFKLKFRSIVHFSGEMRFHEKIFIEPHALFMWTTSTEDLVVGTNLRYQAEKLGVRTGFFHRGGLPDSDALIYKVGLLYQAFEIGFSYDMNISELSQNSTRKSTYEISFIYTAPNIDLQQESIPCERF